MNTIAITVTDRVLALTETINDVPSGGKAYDKVSFTFDSTWNDYTTRTAVFWNDSKKPYLSVLTNNAGVIPREVLASKGFLTIGVMAQNADASIIKNSGVLKIRLIEGAITDTTKFGDPTPTVYEELMTYFNSTKTEVEGYKDTVVSAKNTIVGADGNGGALKTITDVNTIIMGTDGTGQTDGALKEMTDLKAQVVTEVANINTLNERADALASLTVVDGKMCITYTE